MQPVSIRITLLLLSLLLAPRVGHAQSGTAAKSIENTRCMLQDKNGTYWFGSDGGGLYRYDGRSLTLFTHKDGLSNDQVRTIQEDISGKIWMETGNGICSYDGTSFRTFKSETELTIIANSPWRKEPGDTWFSAGTKGGVYRLNGDSVFNYQFPGAETESRSSLPYGQHDVYCIFEDRAGNIWFGTQSKGVCRFDGKNFTWLADKGLAGAAVRVLFQDKAGTLWFGNNGYGLFRYDGHSLRNITQENGLGNPEFIKSFKGKKGTLARVWTINEDTSGALWIGTIDAGAWRYAKHMTNYTTKHGLPNYGITSIYKDRKGTLWFGTEGDVYKFNGKSFSKVVLK